MSSSATTAPIPVARGIIYDREGSLLVKNVPTFVLRIRPSEIPSSSAPRRGRLSRAADVPARKIIERSTPTPARSSTSSASPTCAPRPRASSARTGTVPGRPRRPRGPARVPAGRLVSHVLGWTGRISGPEYERLRDDGYWPEDIIGKAGLEATYETSCVARTGCEEVELDGPATSSAHPRLEEPDAGSLARADHRLAIQRNAEKALQWAMGVVGIDARRVHGHEPADRRDPRDGLAARPTTTTSSRRASRPREYRRLLRDPDRPLLNLAIGEQYPPGSHLQAGDRARRAPGPQDRGARPRSAPRRSSRSAAGSTGTGTRTASARSTSTAASPTPATPSSSGSRACWASTGSPTGRTSSASGAGPASTCPARSPGTVPTNAWKRRMSQPDILPRRGLPGGHRPGLRHGHAAPAHQRLRRARQWRHALPAAARAAHPRERGQRGRGVKPEVIRKLDIDRSVLRTMRVAAAAS